MSNDKEVIIIGDLYGKVEQQTIFWNDDEILKKDLINNKIINIKIFFNSGEVTISKEKNEENDTVLKVEENKPKEEEKKMLEEKYIVGITITFKNLYTGEIKEISHKGSDKILGMKELNLKGNEYLKMFHINFKNEIERISQMGFSTNKNNQISVGYKDGEDKIITFNTGDYVIVGTFGHLFERINCIGCLYVNKRIFIEKLLFGFFLLRKKAKDEDFKKKWDDSYQKLDKSYQFIWRTVNLPDAAFGKVMSFCFL